MNKPLLISKNKIEEITKLTSDQAADLCQDLPIKVIEGRSAVSKAEIHRNSADLCFCLSGEAIFVYGGNLIEPKPKAMPDGRVNQNEIRAKGIELGKRIVVRPGDWLWIPAGVPHQRQCEKESWLTMIKIPSKE